MEVPEPQSNMFPEEKMDALLNDKLVSPDYHRNAPLHAHVPIEYPVGPELTLTGHNMLLPYLQGEKVSFRNRYHLIQRRFEDDTE